MVDATGPWSNRSGYPENGANTGVFHFHHNNGHANNAASFRRIMITKEKFIFVKSIYKEKEVR